MSLLDAVQHSHSTIMRETDLEALVGFWLCFQDVRQAVGDLNSELEAKIYDLMPEKERRIEKVGLITRYRPSSKEYDHDEIIRRLRRVATDPKTGEVNEGVALSLVRKAAAVSYWRIKDLPFELDDELVSRKYGAKKIRRED